MATMQQLTDQIVALGNDLAAVRAELQQLRAQQPQQQQQAPGGGGRADDLIDKNKLYPDPYLSGDSWPDWRDEVLDFIDDGCPELGT